MLVYQRVWIIKFSRFRVCTPVMFHVSLVHGHPGRCAGETLLRKNTSSWRSGQGIVT